MVIPRLPILQGRDGHRPSHEEGSPRTLAEAHHALTLVSSSLRKWFLQRELLGMGNPVTLQLVVEDWQKSVSRSADQATQDAISKRLDHLSYHICAVHPHFGRVFQTALWQRMVEDRSIKWLSSNTSWPIRIMGRGKESFDFSTFSSYLALALYNLLCLADSLRKRQPLNLRKEIEEFLVRSECDAGLDQGKFTTAGLSAGDMLAAQLVSDAALDLNTLIVQYVDSLSRPKFWDYLLFWRWKARLQQARGIADWVKKEVAPRIRALNGLASVFDLEESWAPEQVSAALGPFLETPTPLIFRWLAWRIASRIRCGGESGDGALATFLNLLDGANETGRLLAVAIALDLMAAPCSCYTDTNFQRLQAFQGDRWANICGRLTWRACCSRDNRNQNASSWSSSLLCEWRRTISQVAWHAIRVGPAGLGFVGRFLCSLFQAAEPQSLSTVSRHLPKMDLERLLQQWFQYGFGVLSVHPVDRGVSNAEKSSFKLASLTPDLQVQHDMLFSLRPEIRRILLLQNAAQIQRLRKTHMVSALQ
jgi:hypothetical protein